MTESPRGTREEEFPELLALLNRVFGRHVRPGIEVMYPTFFRCVPEALDHLFVLREDGRIVSHVGVQAQEARVGDISLKLGFVGAVATDPSCQGRGYASTLMKHAVRTMREREFDLSLLGGFRHYYERFGYEVGGGEFSFMVFLNCLRPEMKLPRCEVTVFKDEESRPTAPGELSGIRTAHELEPLRVRRSLEDYRLLLRIPAREVYRARTAGDSNAFAYVVLAPPRWSVHGDWKQASVIDFGGPRELFLALLHHLFTNEGYGLIWVHTPAVAHPIRDALLRVGQEMYLGPIANIRVVNLRRLLDKMRPAMTRRLLASASIVTGEVGMEFTDSEGMREQTTLVFEKDGVGVEDGRRGERVEVNSLALVRLLFGMDVPSRWCPWLERDAARLLDQVLPLDLYAFRMDHV